MQKIWLGYRNWQEYPDQSKHMMHAGAQPKRQKMSYRKEGPRWTEMTHPQIREVLLSSLHNFCTFCLVQNKKERKNKRKHILVEWRMQKDKVYSIESIQHITVPWKYCHKTDVHTLKNKKALR